MNCGTSHLTFVTRPFREALIAEGYDGICDIGGAITGGVRHKVWIAFRSDQIEFALSEPAVRYRTDHSIGISMSSGL